MEVESASHVLTSRTQVKRKFLERAKAIELADDDDTDAVQPMCPKCEDSMSLFSPACCVVEGLTDDMVVIFEENGRILGCGHEICDGELHPMLLCWMAS